MMSQKHIHNARNQKYLSSSSTKKNLVLFLPRRGDAPKRKPDRQQLARTHARARIRLRRSGSCRQRAENHVRKMKPRRRARCCTLSSFPSAPPLSTPAGALSR